MIKSTLRGAFLMDKLIKEAIKWFITESQTE